MRSAFYLNRVYTRTHFLVAAKYFGKETGSVHKKRFAISAHSSCRSILLYTTTNKCMNICWIPKARLNKQFILVLVSGVCSLLRNLKASKPSAARASTPPGGTIMSKERKLFDWENHRLLAQKL